MSQWPFIIYIDKVLREVYKITQGTGVKQFDQDQRQSLFSPLIFEDDTALAVESAELLQCLVTDFEKKNLAKKPNWKGTGEIQGYGVANEINGMIMEVVSSFKCLGSCFSKDGGPQKGVKKRVGEGLKILM